MKNIFLKQNGFSLLEVITAFGIIMIVFISLVGVFPYGLSLSKSAEGETIATYLVQEKMEELINQGYNDIAWGINESKQRLSLDSNNYLYNFQRETNVVYLDQNLNISATDRGLKLITVTVYYPGSGHSSGQSISSDLIINQ